MRARLCRVFVILGGILVIFRSEFIWECGKIHANKPLGLVFWQSRVKVHSALTLFNATFV